jgi:hypothetical protein
VGGNLNLSVLPTLQEADLSSLRKLSIDGNPLKQVPDWVYARVESKGLTFSMWPQCLRGWVKPVDGASECQKCRPGSYVLTGDETECHKDGCGEIFDCLGGANVVPREGLWRAPPYADTIVANGYVSASASCNVTDANQTARGPAAFLRCTTELLPNEKPNVTVLSCPNREACLVVDPANDCKSLAERNGTQPVGCDATPYPVCKVGYHGPLCSLCDVGYVWSEGHKCTECNPDTGSTTSWLAPLMTVPLVMAALVAYLMLLARPIVPSIVPARSLCCVGSSSARAAGPAPRLWRAAKAAASICLAITGFVFLAYQWYEDKVADSAELIAHMVRVLIGFAQIIGNLSGIALSWPKEFYDMARWFDFAKFSFDVPSLACAIQQSGNVEYTFYNRHLLYTVGPLVLIALIALPSLWARLRRLDAATRDDLDDRRVRWTLFAVFLLYPKARTRLALRISSPAGVIRANPSLHLQFTRSPSHS